MEFFEHTPTNKTVEQLQQQLTIERLPDYCGSVDTVLECQGERGRIYCVWGEFSIHRELINGGVRFSLPSCPNSLAWTITTGHEPVRLDMVIHLTISRQQHDEGFIESIEGFVADLKQGLEMS